MSRADRLAKGIYWDRSWNPFSGCTPVGAGCENCWAKRMATRLRGRFGYPADEPFRPTFHPDRHTQVNSKQKPQVIALCFMSDPFHKAHDIDAIWCMLDKVFTCPQHIFIALTKRPEIMRDVLNSYAEEVIVDGPIPNLVGGVSIWDQESADRMIPILLQTNLATRIVSLEPCLRAVDLSLYLSEAYEYMDYEAGHPDTDERRLIDGVILGGESGPGARPMHPDWARSVRDQCQAAGVKFLFKQWGEWAPFVDNGPLPDNCYYVGLDGTIRIGDPHDMDNDVCMGPVGKKAAGRLLDGRTWNELPWTVK